MFIYLYLADEEEAEEEMEEEVAGMFLLLHELITIRPKKK